MNMWVLREAFYRILMHLYIDFFCHNFDYFWCILAQNYECTYFVSWTKFPCLISLVFAHLDLNSLISYLIFSGQVNVVVFLLNCGLGRNGMKNSWHQTLVSKLVYGISCQLMPELLDRCCKKISPPSANKKMWRTRKLYWAFHIITQIKSSGNSVNQILFYPRLFKHKSTFIKRNVPQ